MKYKVMTWTEVYKKVSALQEAYPPTHLIMTLELPYIFQIVEDWAVLNGFSFHHSLSVKNVLVFVFKSIDK